MQKKDIVSRPAPFALVSILLFISLGLLLLRKAFEKADRLSDISGDYWIPLCFFALIVVLVFFRFRILRISDGQIRISFFTGRKIIASVEAVAFIRVSLVKSSGIYGRLLNPRTGIIEIVFRHSKGTVTLNSLFSSNLEAIENYFREHYPEKVETGRVER